MQGVLKITTFSLHIQWHILSINMRDTTINDTIFKLAILAGNEMAEKGHSLEDIRKNPEISSMPIGCRALFYLLKNQKLSLKGQIKLIEYFGLKWELIIIDHKF